MPGQVSRFTRSPTAARASATSDVGDLSEIELTELQRGILSLVKQSPSITAKQMSETLSVSRRTIERDLSAMKKMGILARMGKDNAGAWIILSLK